MRSPPEDEEFRRATRDVEPLPAPRRVKLSRAPAAPVPEQTRRDESEVGRAADRVVARVDDPTEPEADRGEVEHRREEVGHQRRAPQPAVDPQLALDDPRRPVQCHVSR